MKVVKVSDLKYGDRFKLDSSSSHIYQKVDKDILEKAGINLFTEEDTIVFLENNRTLYGISNDKIVYPVPLKKELDKIPYWRDFKLDDVIYHKAHLLGNNELECIRISGDFKGDSRRIVLSGNTLVESVEP